MSMIETTEMCTKIDTLHLQPRAASYTTYLEHGEM